MLANPAYLSGFLCSGLLRVAPYYVPGGIRVVSIEAHSCFTILLARGMRPKYVHYLAGHSSIQLTLDRYSHWMPSMGRNTADGMDEALG
jgi:integrase